MAIPNWVWEDRCESGGPSRRLRERDIDRVSETLEILSNPVRLEILSVLDGREDGLSYSELRAAISISDNGKLNYHLRRLDGFVRRTDGRYTLRERGSLLLRTVAAEAARDPT